MVQFTKSTAVGPTEVQARIFEALQPVAPVLMTAELGMTLVPLGLAGAVDDLDRLAQACEGLMP